MVVKFDKYDEKILYELDRNSRISSSLIAKKAGLSKEAIIYRIKRLKKTGYIRYFYSIVNASNIGYNYAWVLLKFQNVSSETQKQIVEYILNKANISNLRIMEGIFDIAFLCIYKKTSEIKTFLQELTKQFGQHLSEKKILIILKSYKFSLNKIPTEPMNRIILTHSDLRFSNITPLDIKILKVLSSNARIKILDLAREVKADPGTLRYHIKKMEKEGIIAGYSMALDLKKYRNEYHQINIGLRNYDAVTRIIEFFDRTNSCLYAYEVLGRYDLSIDIFVEDVYGLRRILEKFKELFSEEYLFYDISHIINEHKINWSPFD